MAGRRVCAWCGRDLGAAPGLPDGDVTHGMCTACKRRFDEELDRAERERRRARERERSNGT